MDEDLNKFLRDYRRRKVMATEPRKDDIPTYLLKDINENKGDQHNRNSGRWKLLLLPE